MRYTRLLEDGGGCDYDMMIRRRKKKNVVVVVV